LATNYDAAEGAFTSLTQAENYRGASVTSPWINACHEIEVDAMRDINRHYNRSGAPPSGTDIRLYDVGNFQLIASGVTNAAASYPCQIGELYVEYDIDFFDPRVQVPIGQNLPAWHGASVGTATAAAPLLGMVTRAGSTFTPVLTNTTATIQTVGRYLVAFSAYAANVTGVATLSTTGNVVNVMDNNQTNNNTGFQNDATSSVFGIVDITVPGQTITIGGSATMSGGNADLFIVQMSSGLLQPEQKQRVPDEKTPQYESVLRAWGVQDAMSVLQTDEKSWSDIDRQTVKLFGEEARKELAKERHRPPRLARIVPRRLAPPVLDQDLSDEEKGFEKVLATPASAKTSKSVPGK
jgi:hypothetical protein